MARTIYTPETCTSCGQTIPAGSRVKAAYKGVTHQGNCPAAVPSAQNYSERQIVIAGSVAVGETIRGLRVVSFGRSWYVDDEDNSAYGAQPGVPCQVQYAYLTEV